MEESKLILPELTELCQKYRVLTTDSQPAYVTDSRRQRGYIEGAIQIEHRIFVQQLNQLTDLEYIARCGDKCYSRVTFKDGWWSFSENFVNDEWDSRTHFGIDSLIGITQHEDYETDDYNMIDDPSITFFTVCDPCFGCQTNHCCLELMKVLERQVFPLEIVHEPIPTGSILERRDIDQHTTRNTKKIDFVKSGNNGVLL